MMRPGMSRRIRRLVLTVVLSSMLCAVPAVASFKHLKPGMEAADFSLQTLDDLEITLATLKKSPATLLGFWATWSPKSEPALREAQALEGRHAGRGLRVVANPSFALFDGRGVLVWDGAGWSRSVQDSIREQVESLLGLRGPQAADAVKGHQPAHKALLNFNLGRTFLRQGNPGKARDLLAAAAAADQAWSAPRTTLGYLLLQQAGGRGLAQAEALFREAVAIDSGDVSALTGLGETLMLANRFEEAAPILEKAQALDAVFTPAVAGRARVLARQGRSAEALALFAAALELNPRDAAILAGRAGCQEAEGNLADATADYRRALEILLGAH